MPRKKQSKRWEDRLGQWPRVVWYGERLDKGGVVYTRTWSEARQNWKWESCRLKVRDAKGNLVPELQAQVIEIAKRRHDIATGKFTPLAVSDLPPITFKETWALLTNESGRFPNKTTYRDELEAGINHATSVLGEGFVWMHLDDAAFTKVIREKVKSARKNGFTGYRVAVQAGTSLIAIMGLLKELKRVPSNVAAPGGKRWRADLKQFVAELQDGIEPEPVRARHTLDQVRGIIAKAPEVDPRFDLLICLGAELRLGQVRRARRSNLDPVKGIFRSPGRGKKKGAIVELTDGQRAAVQRALDGYLAPLERSMPDYPLFMAGRLVTRDGIKVAVPEIHGEAAPIDKRTINDWWRAAETLAGVPHVKGLAAYGGRRRLVDAALDEDISPDALREHGGWTSDRMPQEVYRGRNREKAQHEAMVIRSRIRGENVAESYPATPNTHTEPAETPHDETR
jgi:integrase